MVGGVSMMRRLSLLAPVLGLAWAMAAVAQSEEQLEIFQSLTPEQQRQVLEQMQRDAAAPTRPEPARPIAESKPDTTADPRLDRELRLGAGDTLLLDVSQAESKVDDKSSIQRTEEPRASREFRRSILSGNPYRLDRLGRLVLNGGATFELAGLTAEEAEARLNADPALEGFRFDVRLLRVDGELRLFGYELFRTVPTTFAPATDIPVPAEYVIGPGDTLEVQLIGEGGGRHTLVVGRDGEVAFPEIGPIAVAGMRFDAARTLLERSVAEQMIGMRASISMGPLRSIQVFVLGEAERPGSYTVSGLSTITNTLFVSGGVKPIGSLRNIELKRGGQIVRRLDLYDLLLNGDTSNDARLLPGDVIFIPPIGPTVAIDGEVKRPAIYEIRAGAAASDLLFLAGGLTQRADPATAWLERIEAGRGRTVLDLDLASSEGLGLHLRDGDRIRVHAIREVFENTVMLEGFVHRPRSQQFRAGMRLTDLLDSLDELRPRADLHYALIRRESGPNHRVSVTSADIARAFADPASTANVPLQPRDRVHVFDLDSSRDHVIAPILRDLARQSALGEPRQEVGIGGRVKVPGQYPLELGMTISDLLRAGGMLDEAAYGGNAELTRYEIVGGEQRQTELIGIDLSRVLSGDAEADIRLQPYDYLLIREIPDWYEQETITVAGEVRFPGIYPFERGETLRSVIQRAGGLTRLAFVDGSVFTREELREREQRQIEVLAVRLQRELAALSLQQARGDEAAGTGQAMATGQVLLADLRGTQAIGRLVIDLEAVIGATPGSTRDLIVKHGDRLFVPRLTQEVTVIGEVQNATSHFFEPGLERDDYVERSGGFTQRSDRKRMFVIRADGSVAVAQAAGWFRRNGADIQPGDTVVVPMDARQLEPLTVWTSVTQILYQIAIAVAAVNSL
ncbi:MAG: SLBB domain-containing protein [Gammaproteobacteria bacterium]